MICKHCGAKIDDSSIICPNCGEDVIVTNFFDDSDPFKEKVAPLDSVKSKKASKSRKIEYSGFYYKDGDPNNAEKITAAIYSLFFGAFGLQHFYLRCYVRGILSALFFWTLIPSILGIFYFFYFLIIPKEKFKLKYCNK